jgi:hypothetical protein
MCCAGVDANHLPGVDLLGDVLRDPTLTATNLENVQSWFEVEEVGQFRKTVIWLSVTKLRPEADVVLWIGHGVDG